VSSHCGGYNTPKVDTIILTNVMISATICHPIPATHHLLESMLRVYKRAYITAGVPENILGVYFEAP